jgi:hypothetical protein
LVEETEVPGENNDLPHTITDKLYHIIYSIEYTPPERDSNRKGVSTCVLDGKHLLCCVLHDWFILNPLEDDTKIFFTRPHDT